MTVSTGDSPPERGSTRPRLGRITVALIPKAEDDLRLLQERTGLSRTDITNRAITLYEFVDDQLRAGRDMLIRDNQTGETQIVRIL
jgi:hypothetical protein